MDSSFNDTVSPVRFVPHTPRSVSKAVVMLESDGIPAVSVDTFGNVMSVLFLDGSDGVLWYRSNKEGSDFGIPESAFQEN